jgi:hypothetical protein
MAVTSPESAKEPKITKKLAEKMGEFISNLNVTDQWQLNKDVSGERKAAGRPDILFVKPKSLKLASQEGKSEENDRDVVALLEVGIQKVGTGEDFSLWMSKLGQGSRYLKEMAKDGTTGPVNSTLKNVDGNPKFRGPALLGIVTFDEKRTFMKVGVFCCEPLDGAKLLDFDFSGRNVYYTDGYAQWLPDAGMRPGTKHEEITEACDIQALLTVFSMFELKDCHDDIKLLAWWSNTKSMAYKKLLKDSSEVFSWMIEQFEPHSEVRIEISNHTTRKKLAILEEMNRSKMRKTTELDTKSPEK